MESLRNKRIACLLTVVGLGLIACGSEDEQKTSADTLPKGVSSGEVGFKAEVYANGTRKITFSEKGHDFSILQACDGKDLVEITNHIQASSGNGIQRSPLHRACADDGRLSPADFPTP